jgi:twinkle protein
MVDECKPTPVKGVLNLAEVQYIDPATLPRILTKIPDLDTCIGGLGEGSVTVFTGKRGEGKSTLNGQLMLNAIEQGYKVCAYSGELSASKFKEWILLQATEAKYVDTKIDERTGKVYPMVSSEIQKRINEYIDGKFWLYDNTQIDTAKTQESIIAVFTNCARQFGCKLFVVDNLMVALNAPDQENQAQAKFAAELKNFAVKYKVAVILVAHPRKTKAGEQLTNDDVSGSSAITNLADNVIAVEKPNLNVTKNRDFGELTYIECAYSPINRRIFQVNTGDTFRYSWNHTGIGKPETPAIENPSFAIKTGENRSAVNF